MGRGGALVESIPFNRRVVGRTLLYTRHVHRDLGQVIHSGYLCRAPSLNLLRGALSPATAKQKCLKKSFTCSCLWRFGLKLQHSIRAVSGVVVDLKRRYRSTCDFIFATDYYYAVCLKSLPWMWFSRHNNHLLLGLVTINLILIVNI